MGGLINQKMALSSINHWAEAFKRFCITVGGVVAAVSVFVQLNQFSQILIWQCCLHTTTFGTGWVCTTWAKGRLVVTEIIVRMILIVMEIIKRIDCDRWFWGFPWYYSLPHPEYQNHVDCDQRFWIFIILIMMIMIMILQCATHWVIMLIVINDFEDL